MSSRTRGACLCGAVTFAIAPPYRWFAHCHCLMCRKHGGTLFGTGLGVDRDALEWLGGADDVVHYRASAAFERPFCRRCGSTLPAISHDERYWHVPAGLLIDDPGTRPRSHIFFASKSSLYETTDDLPRHAEYPPGIKLPIFATRMLPGSRGIVGSCLCDAIAFEATAVRRVVNCYCSLCRRRSGGAFTSTLLADANAFHWLRGAERARRYALPAPRTFATEFCAECGSPVPVVLATHPSALLPAGAVDSDSAPQPAVHIYVGSKAPWVTITDAWPQFDELPPPERFTEFFE